MVSPLLLTTIKIQSKISCLLINQRLTPGRKKDEVSSVQ